MGLSGLLGLIGAQRGSETRGWVTALGGLAAVSSEVSLLTLGNVWAGGMARRTVRLVKGPRGQMMDARKVMGWVTAADGSRAVCPRCEGRAFIRLSEVRGPWCGLRSLWSCLSPCSRPTLIDSWSAYSLVRADCALLTWRQMH